MASEESISFTHIDWQRQEHEDDLALQQLLNEGQEQGAQSDLFDANRPLDLGEKADDAEDFEDISDDDLPDEELATRSAGHQDHDARGLVGDMDVDEVDGYDDLFGDGDDRATSPFEERNKQEDTQTNGAVPLRHMNGGLTMPSLESELEPEPLTLEQLRALNFPVKSEDVILNPDFPSIQADADDIIRKLWPAYEKDGIPFFNSLMPPVKEYFVPKTALKPPKPVNPTKVSLDLAPDQEKSFRTAGSATLDKRKRILEAEAKGLVAIVEDSSDEEDLDEGFDYSQPDPNEKIGGKTWKDLEIICADWESKINPEFPEPQIQEEEEDEPMDEWEREILGHSAKRKKVVREVEKDFVIAPQYPIPNFDNFEQMTVKIAKRAVLDLNDPYLLVDIQQVDPAAKRRRLGITGQFKRVGNGSFASTLSRRFNISNDEAYDALKENHQSKVRATLGNLSVEHSMPALKLQWPYYRVKLYTREARSFHRPSLKFNKFLNQPIYFSKPGQTKRKAIKNMSTQDIFKTTKDLSLADHYSTATLLEYSEEHPTVLSNFGMGNRIINYYRRKDADDTDRPQPEDKVGDVTILLPEDKSPFANFGMVDPGETVRTIHNAMYRAPIFKHEPKPTDFLVIRSSTGVGGSSWYIRNIDNMFVVGQQFPSVEIPGPHSRKVTNAAKNRMKMIAFRKIRHSPQKHMKIGEITAHITDSTDMQNRQKLKEFINYDKVEKVWRMRPGEPVPEEAQIRQMVKPEEICVIDAMQVGARHLEDSGLTVQDDDDDEETENLEQSLAPWKTSKAFLEASADKAMLALHGAGDPSGCGLAFSFIKTSMKGGYLENLQGPDSTAAMAAARAVATDKSKNGGHGYNVKVQQKIYNDAIRVIWEAQKKNLSDPNEREENDLERETAVEGERHGIPQTPHSMATPAAGFDDTASQYSTKSQTRRDGKVLRIVRKFRNKFNQEEEVTEIVKDPAVYNQYIKRRHQLDAEKLNVYELKPTGNIEVDRREALRIKEELARLNRNKERRHAREKQKGRLNGKRRESSVDVPESAVSPSSTPTASVEKPTGTTRKCANCGMAGHIKTNKKLCPMLNGTMKQEDLAPNNGGFGAIQAPSFG